MPHAVRPALWIAAALAALACSRTVEVPAGGPVAGWPEYGGTPGGTRHSPLTQITPENVGALSVAWTYHSGDIEDGSHGMGMRSSFQATPILVGDTLYFCTPFNRVIALDAESGAERWTYDPHASREGAYNLNCRGVSSWRDESAPEGAACRTRTFTGTLDARLLALDAARGEPCADFGEDGVGDLREGSGDTKAGEYGVTSPPAVLGDRVITGALVLDNRRVDAPGGVVRAWDARTGARVWAWDPVPPGSPAFPGGPGRAYHRGTANAWTAFSVDAALGLVYVPTGNTAPASDCGLRNVLDFYSSSVVALDGRTGEVRWHFPTVHHDLWDYDAPSQPVFLDFARDGAKVPALIQPTKMGHLFFLDRRSGEPLFPVEERPVPQGGVPGETLSPTQPFPIKPAPLHPATLTPDDAFGFTPWDRARCREQIASVRSEGIFTPPSLQGTIQYPGMVGGANWGSGSVDPERGVFIINTMRLATYIRLVPRAEYEKQFPDGPPKMGFE